MKGRNETIFHNPTAGTMDLTGVAKEIAAFICCDPASQYRLVVGTDSEGVKQPDFVTAIIVHRARRGGRYFWTKTNTGITYHTLRDRIHGEVTLSLKTAQDILGQPELSAALERQSDCDFQIHIDIGPKGPTRDMIKEVVAIVQGNGFKAKIKPESFGASNVADKHA